MDFESLTYKLISYLKNIPGKMAAEVNHRTVIKDIYLEVDISPGYFLFLTLANLIALSGLITNSAAVIIGAMLISPLMGPILSCGFAFITGDWTIGKKALRKVTLSVAVTIVIAAFATYLSPLHEVTDEILSRTRPNLYDLIIAFFAGIAGAIAICTRKNYITIVTGVAIATAVIPPLSVAGFGMGTWNFYVAGGGFFLFFTNFVAIIFATSIIFFLYGFKPGIITEIGIAQLRKRIIILTLSFIIIAIPLIYTLHVSVSEVRLRGNINFALKQEFDVERRSHLATFGYVEGEEDTLEISAIVNTVDYLKEAEVKRIEEKVARYLNRDVILNVEQVRVQTGGLKEEAARSPLLPTLVPSRPPSEIIRSSREDSLGTIRKTVEKIDRIIAPSIVDDFYIGFHYKATPVVVSLKIKKDTPMTESEIQWLSKILSEDLGHPVDLKVETIPFITPLVFNRGETTLSDEMKTVLLEIKKVYQRDPSSEFVVESYPETASRKEKMLAEERAGIVVNILVDEFKIPRESVKKIVHRSTMKSPVVRISVL
ncbi:MAG: TIGR00341 family protein [Nitrospirae bacterium]|nr:TIGR00341 family protein [Nitrospirota bacterium]